MRGLIALSPRPVYMRVHDLGGKASPGIHMAGYDMNIKTTKYTLILPRSHSGRTADVRLEKPKAGANRLTPCSHNVDVVRMLRLERKPASNSCGW